MDHHDRIAAAQPGVFDVKALAKVRDAYIGVVAALDPKQTSDEAQRAEIADALFFLARGNPELSAQELQLHVVATIRHSL